MLYWLYSPSASKYSARTSLSAWCVFGLRTMGRHGANLPSRRRAKEGLVQKAAGARGNHNNVRFHAAASDHSRRTFNSMHFVTLKLFTCSAGIAVNAWYLIHYIAVSMAVQLVAAYGLLVSVLAPFSVLATFLYGAVRRRMCTETNGHLPATDDGGALGIVRA